MLCRDVQLEVCCFKSKASWFYPIGLPNHGQLVHAQHDATCKGEAVSVRKDGVAGGVASMHMSRGKPVNFGT